MVTHSFYESDNRIIRYAETLAARGDEVHVVALRRAVDLPVDEVINGVQLHRIQDRLGKRESSRLSFLWPLLRFTFASSRWLNAQRRRAPFDLVHVHNIPDFLVFCTWYVRLRGAKVILDIHDIVPEFFASKFDSSEGSLLVRGLRWMEKASAAMADRVILANHLWLGKYTSRSARADKCMAIINNVDEQVFHPLPRRRSGTEPRIVFPGGLQWHQGLDIAIRAVALLRRRLPDARFDIYGEGAMKPQLIALVAELGLEEGVRFHDPVKLRDIAQIMADADLGVVPKRADSFGNEAYSTKIMEFMAVGVPVVISRTMVDQYYFDDSVVRFFPSGDHEALAAAMFDMLSGPGLAEARAQAQRGLAYVGRHGWSRHKQEYLDLVDSLVGGRDAPAPRADAKVSTLPTAPASESRVMESLGRLDGWVRAHDYRAYDPGDGQMSFLRHVTFGRMPLERVLTATVLRTPLNIRPLLGIRAHTSTKGMGYMAWGYLYRYRALGQAVDAERARHCLDWLIAHSSPTDPRSCWGNEFTFTTRAGRIPRGAPTIVWSGLVGQAFMEAYDTLGDRRYLDVATSTCDWILSLPRERTDRGACLSYVAFHQVSIHNSNMLGGALLARVGAAAGREDFLALAAESMRYSCERQNDDGAWYYGEAAKYHWIDNFHTGYNLDSLLRYRDATGDTQFDAALERGYAYFRDTFMEPDGRPKYMHDRVLPTDIQCAAQAIDTLVNFAERDDGALDLARKVADWTIEHMQAPDGHFYYRDLGWTKIRTPMFHWGQGTMFKALAHLLAKQRQQAAAPIPARIAA